MSQPVCPGSGLWNDLRFNPKTCLCEPRTPTPTPPPSPKKEKPKNCTKRNPPVKIALRVKDIARVLRLAKLLIDPDLER